MRSRIFVGSLFSFSALFWGALWAEDPISIRGIVTAGGSPVEGAFVGAHGDDKTFTTFVMTDGEGQFAFRGLAPGRYTVFTRISGFRMRRNQDLRLVQGQELRTDFQVEPETDYLELVRQATNSELMESFPLSAGEKKALDYRCGDCHGAHYIARSRFTFKDWMLIVSRMDDQASITTAGDLSPPPRMARPGKRVPEAGPAGSENESIATLLARFRGPDSPDFPIKFQPRASGKQTRAVVTEYQIPRLGAAPRTVAVRPDAGEVWYSDWRANFLGKVEVSTGEITEFAIPGVKFRPPGLQELRWDPLGNLLAGQIWAGRAIRFDVQNKRITGIWGTPLEWARVGSVGVCQSEPHGPVRYLIADALERRNGWIIDPETSQLTEIDVRADLPAECDRRRSYNNWEGLRERGVMVYQDPQTGQRREFAPLSPWAGPDNAIGDPLGQVGWSVPFVIERVVKADLKTGKVSEFPLPSHGKRVLNIDIEMSADPPALWFVNQRLGKIVRFQEFTE